MVEEFYYLDCCSWVGWLIVGEFVVVMIDVGVGMLVGDGCV